LAERTTADRQLEAISYYAPAMAIFFLFFAIGFGARSFFSERDSGTLDRIAAAPVRPSAVIAGKSLSVLIYGAMSMTVLIVFTGVFFGAQWGDPLATAVLTGAMIISVVCLTALVMTLARTERQADAFASIAVFGLALLGGNFIFVGAAPVLLRRLALLTPNGWALRGYVDLATGSGHVGTVLVPIGAILCFSVVVALVATLFARRVFER
jgi:ABC-2 type transport system permease protein